MLPRSGAKPGRSVRIISMDIRGVISAVLSTGEVVVAVSWGATKCDPEDLEPL